MRTICTWSALILACAVAVSTSYSEPSHNPDSVNGHKLALLICSACHIAAPDQNKPPILRTPAVSFQSLAEKEGTSYEGIRNFILTTHQDISHPKDMPNPMLTDDEASDISAYIVSLRRMQ